MKKLLIIDTTWPINTRTERFKNTLEKYFKVLVVAWNRGIETSNNIPDNTYVLDTNIGYGNQIKKILKMPVFFLHLYKICKREKPDVIFASHWDSLICAVTLKLISNWKLKIIYDCLDLPTFSNIIIRKIILFVEKVCLLFVNLTIFASRYFKPLYSKNIKSYVFENYPSVNLINSPSPEPVWMKHCNEKELINTNSISWIGVVRYFEIIQNILLAIKGTNIKFLVYGDGPDLEKLIKEVKDNNLEDQVLFFGRYKSSDIKYIYQNSDLVWAAYPTNDFNAIYAISNKYFECSYFEKKIILSKKTKMAQNLSKKSSVIVVDEYSPSDIKDKLLYNINLKGSIYEKYEENVTWEDKEVEFIEFIMKNI